MWSTLSYLDKILDNVDQKAAETLKGKEEIKIDVKTKNDEFEKKLVEIQNEKETSKEDISKKEQEL